MLKHVTYRSTSSLSRASSTDFSSSSSCRGDTISLKSDPRPPHPTHPHTPKYYRTNESPPGTPPRDTSLPRSYRTEGVTLGHRQDLDQLDGIPPPADALSLSSSISLASLATPRLSSRCSSTASLTGEGPTVSLNTFKFIYISV